MNREIKFRAWHKEAKEMFIEDGIKYRFGECLKFLWEKQPVEVMQYTGLKDKKGKEIYEGDIVARNPRYKYIPAHGKYDTAEQVEMTEIAGSDDMGIDCIGYPDYWKEMEVIGNLYENPELMEEGKVKE